MFFFDPTFVLLIPAMILAFWAQSKVKSTYRKFSLVDSVGGASGTQTARQILNMNGLNDVNIEEVAGELTDHYDPRSRTVRLSTFNASSHSVAAVGVAAHEVGHAIQHAKGYTALKLRHVLLKPANFGSTLAFPLFLIGMFFGTSFGKDLTFLMDVGIIFFLAALAFQVITLPVEFDASRRALVSLRSTGILHDKEVDGARKVLQAASWTYVAAATMALTQLIRLIVLRNMVRD
ncbi:zinc metallopeptidase [Calditrichota bacterium]